MDLTNRTDHELGAALEQLQHSSPAGAKAADQLQEVLHGLQIYRMELETQNRVLRDSQGELESAIRRQNDLYDFSPTGYLTLDQAGKIEDANLTAAGLLFTERAALRGQNLARFIDGGDNQRLVAHLNRALSDNPSVVAVTLRPLGLNSPLAVQLSSRLAPSLRDRAPQVLTAITDVSALQAVQQHLQEVNREQESFCYSISHDLRSPLITISNLSSLVLSEFPEEITGEARDCLQRIHLATQRMEQLLTDLLEYSRVSRSSVQRSPVDVEQVVDDILGQHHGVIQDKAAKISVKRPLGQVCGSREALGQVLANLLTNALKFVVPGERPTVEISSQENDSSIVIIVRDHGIGIPPEHRHRIFGVFERLHGQTQYPGTGVGLAIVRCAVDRMGGRIWLDSPTEGGSRFSVELPKA